MRRQVDRDLIEQIGDLGRVSDRRVDGDVRQVGDAEEVEGKDVGLGDDVGDVCSVASAGDALEPAARVARPRGILAEVPRERFDRGCQAIAKDMLVKQLVLRCVVAGEGNSADVDPHGNPLSVSTWT
jgi:hypothetical protein